MRLVKEQINKDNSGKVILCPEEPEDMYSAYDLIRPDDLLTASAVRRITTESSTTGSTASHRVHTNLTIRIKSTNFDSLAGQLHVSGQIARETSAAKIGQFHTLDLELNRNFTLEKEVEGDYGNEGWDSVARAQLIAAIDKTKGTETVAVIMQEGLANICFLTQHQTVLRQKIEVSVPRKRTGDGRSADHDKGLAKFYSTVLESLMRQLMVLLENKDRSTSFSILLASPGFIASNFLRHITEIAALKGVKLLQDLIHRKAFLVAHSSSGHLHSLNEVLQSTEVRHKLKTTRYVTETDMMDKFETLLRKDDGRAWYGPREVEACVEKGAVGRGGGVLFISNDLFRSPDVAIRRRWVKLHDRVRDVEGGQVNVLSGDHESGKRLENFGGIAAILTFPIDDIELDDDEEL